MNDLHVRSAIPEDALKIARLWIQCTLEVASLEPVYTPAVDQEKLADIQKVELAYVTEDPRPQKVWSRHGFKPYFVHAFKTLD